MPIGQLRLLIPDPCRLTESAAQRSYLAGPDQIPWLDRARLQDNMLIVDRHMIDSGKLYVPWQVDGRGEVMLATGTLMLRDRPYQLPVELARGKLNTVRMQLFDWQSIGLVVPGPVESAMHRAMEQFALAATSQHDPSTSAQHAQQAIATTLDVADALAAAYVDQALAVRHKVAPRLPTQLGAVLGHRLFEPHCEMAFQSAFNAATVPLTWRQVCGNEDQYDWHVYDQQIQWCRDRKIHCSAGPLLQLDDLGIPDWLSLWDDDDEGFNGLISFAADYVTTVVRRYKGKVAMWQCASRVNHGKLLSLSDEQKARLAIRAVEVTRRIDPETPVILRFDQPWCEYMRRTEADRSPLHFADDLIRAGLPISGIGLDINIGYLPEGSSMRDRLDFSRLIDLWTCLGLPLHLFLTVPSGNGPDPQATSKSQTHPEAWAGGWSPAAQSAWVQRYVPLLMAKPAVQSITWNQLFDADPHELPHGGLFDVTNTAKPALAALAAIRKKHLN